MNKVQNKVKDFMMKINDSNHRIKELWTKLKYVITNNTTEDYMDDKTIEFSTLTKTLSKDIETFSKIFIVGHNNPDYDCIGSALGIATLVKEQEKEVYIIVNDPIQELDPGVKKVIDDSKNQYSFIELEEYKRLADKNSLLIIVDVNKDYRISVQKNIDKVGNIMIIDHHEETENNIQSDYKFIDTKASSTCEIVAQILNSKQVKYSKNIANYLLAGMILDTKRFQKNTSATTLDTAEKLCRKGADYDAVNKLFISNFFEDDRIYSLVFGKKVKEQQDSSVEIVIANTHIQAYPQLLGEPTVSFTVNREKPTTIYKQVDLAKTADKMLKYADMAVVIGYVNSTDVGISARSKSDIDVGEIMGKLETLEFPMESPMPPEQIIRSGGGNKGNAGGRVTTSDIFSVEKVIMDYVQELATPHEETETPVILVKKTKIEVS